MMHPSDSSFPPPNEGTEQTLASQTPVPQERTIDYISENANALASGTIAQNIPSLQEPQQQTSIATNSTLPKIANYELKRELGEGGMGIVYEATDLKLQRVVALKMIRQATLAKADTMLRFLAEAESLAKLQHPHIVQVFDKGQYEGLPFYTMEFCPGGSLEDQVKTTPMSAWQAARVVEKIARAVGAAHVAGILHRDLKPANVLFTSDGTPKVTDFGLAKRLDESGQGVSGLTLTGNVMGTPPYMAPEQAKGETKKVGAALDIYALGAILYRLVTGRPPFLGANAAETLRQVIEVDPVSPSQLTPGLPRDLTTIVLKCLEKEPARRYASAFDLADDLQRFLDHLPITARPVGQVEKAWRWCRRNPVIAGLTTCLFFSMMIGIAVSMQFAWKAHRNLDQANQNKLLADQNAEKAKEEEQKAKDQAFRADKEAAEARKNAIRANTEAERSRKNAERAEAQLNRAERLLYASRLARAQSLWEQHQVGEAEDLINRTRWDMRGIEYRILYTQMFHTGQRKLFGHDDAVQTVCWNPNGRHIASAGKDKIIHVWDAFTGEPIYKLKGHSESITCLAWNADGSCLASGSEGKVIRLWDFPTGTERKMLSGSEYGIRCLDWSPDGRFLASVGGKPSKNDGELKIWDTRSGQILRSETGSLVPCQSIAWSPDGRFLALGCTDNTIRIRNAKTYKEQLILKGHIQAVLSLDWSPDGTQIVSASADKTIRLWDIQTGQEKTSHIWHTEAVASVRWSPDGSRIAAGSEDNTVSLWDIRTGEQSFNLKGHRVGVTSISWCPDGTRLVSASKDHGVIIWDARTGQNPMTLRIDEAAANCASWSPDGRKIVAKTSPNSFKIWDAQTGQELQSYRWFSRGMNSISWSPDGKRIAAGSGGLPGGFLGEIRIWDVETEQEILSFRGDLHVNSNLSWSPDSTQIAAGGWDTQIRVWNAQTGQIELQLKGHKQPVRTIRWDPNGQWLASGDGGAPLLSGEVKIWDIHSRKERFTFKGHTSDILSLSWSPDGTKLASSGADNLIKLWDVISGSKIQTLKGHSENVWSIDWSPDQTRLLSGSGDSTVRIWDVATGQETLSLEAHTAAIYSTRWSPDGNRILSAGSRELKIWNGQTVQEYNLLEGGKNGIASVKWSADGTRIVREDKLKKHMIWDVRTGEAMLDEPVPEKLLEEKISPDGRYELSHDSSWIYVRDLKPAFSQESWQYTFHAGWHQQQEREASQKQDWGQVLYHSLLLAEADPMRPQWRMLRQSSLNRFPSRITDLAFGSMDLNDRKSWNRLVDGMVKSKRDLPVERLARVFILGSIPEETSRMLEMAQKLEQSSASTFDVITTAALYFRANRIEDAKRLLTLTKAERAIALPEIELLSALILLQENQLSEAKQELAKAESVLFQTWHSIYLGTALGNHLNPLAKVIHYAMPTEQLPLKLPGVDWRREILLKTWYREAITTLRRKSK